jgi:hypothetical protein
MPVKIMGFLGKRHDVTDDELITHYENRHVPLVLSLAPPPLSYKCNFLLHDDTTASRDDVDIITELVFRDRHAYEDWVSAMYAPGSGVAEDEARFLDRSKTRAYVVEERST